MRLLGLHVRGSVAINDIFGLKWRHSGLKGGILDYGEYSYFGLLSYYML